MDLLERFAVQYAAGTVLFRQGDTGNEMYVVLSGEVEIAREAGEARQVLAHLGPEDFFGEMAIINRRPRTATATVLAASRLLVVDDDIFEAVLRARPQIAVRMIRALAGRLDRANQQVEILLLRDANHRVVRTLRTLAEDQGARAAASGDSAPLRSAAVYLPIGVAAIAARVGLSASEVQEVLDRLAAAQLVVPAAAVGHVGDGYLVPEVGRLTDFLEFER